jgi:lipopolysaccharide/colanic/teichoic acid biosynthesis glycosyltransferase
MQASRNGISDTDTVLRNRAMNAKPARPLTASGPSYEELVILPRARRRSPKTDRRARDGRHRFSNGAIRVLDVCVSTALLVFLAPLLLLIAVAVFLFDPGPVFFAHRRIGRNGVPFPCYKFRSMYRGAEQRLETVLAADPVRRAEWARDHKLSDDPRITRIGALLRVTSLDELPQLVNVIRGEMTLVGPRPIVQAEVCRYGRFISAYYSVKPGLTGLWQVSGRSSTTYRRRIASDVLYVRSRSIALDLRILAATVPAVISARGSI